MITELNFVKSECNEPWGFRLVGGIDYDLPPIVVNVCLRKLHIIKKNQIINS